MRIRSVLSACLVICGYLFADDAPVTQLSDSADIIQPSTGTAIIRPPINTDTIYIRGIEIYGNATTRPEILKRYFAFDTGEVLDTSRLRLTRANLVNTQLYDKVDIFPHIREDGAHVFVMLKESVRLLLSYGGQYSTYKYGREDFWIRFSAEAGYANFRGRMEEFTVGVSAWDHRSLDISWYKPFLPTPYYMLASAGVAAYPDFILPLDYTDVFSKLTVGRSLGARSRVSLSAIPIYRHRSIVESMIAEPDSTPGSGSGASLIPPSFRADLFEAFAALAFTADRRSARFDPRSGWLLQSQLRTNHPYHGVNVPFFQLTGEGRYYIPLPDGDLAALRLHLTLRDTDAGAYHRLTFGGTGQILGYSEDALGWYFVANSAVLASAKYHKRLYETPPLPVPLINLVFAGVNRIRFKIDAAFLLGYARLYEDNLGALLLRGPWQDGVGIGFGTRIMAPEVRQSGCLDLVFGRVDERDGEGYRWAPALHLYLDLFY